MGMSLGLWCVLCIYFLLIGEQVERKVKTIQNREYAVYGTRDLTFSSASTVFIV